MGDEVTVVRTIILMACVALLALCLCMMGHLDQAKGQAVYGETYEIQRGDVDGDGIICLNDPVFLLYHLFRDSRPLPCEMAADADGSGCIDVGDVVHSLHWLFRGDVYMTGSFLPGDCELRLD
tara:strand:+ start:160 stop:528 length:369 start_codon:yes stop_codon:yes gene_type:complete